MRRVSCSNSPKTGRLVGDDSAMAIAMRMRFPYATMPVSDLRATLSSSRMSPVNSGLRNLSQTVSSKPFYEQPVDEGLRHSIRWVDISLGQVRAVRRRGGTKGHKNGGRQASTDRNDMAVTISG